LSFLATVIIAGLLSQNTSFAGPMVAAGDSVLRHDIQRLADYGVIKGPTSTLPLAWGPLMADITSYNHTDPLPRDITDAFETKWLSWLGPWDLAVHFGQMESDREIPNTRFFGMRFNFRPIRPLEIGLSRMAQWCGDGRPCGLDTFMDLFFGRESSGFIGENWSYRWFGEFTGTSCQFHESSEIFNCAYNHGIYQTGYRYRGRAVGHGADNDSRIISAGLVLVNEQDSQWQALLRYGALRRGGAPDACNSLIPTRQDIASIELTHYRHIKYGRIGIGLGWNELTMKSADRRRTMSAHFLSGAAPTNRRKIST
jgi:hypothetical protein